MPKTLGEYLIELREGKGWGISEAAEKTKIHRAYLWLLENGRRQKPRPEILNKLSKGYGISVENLINYMGYAAHKTATKKEELTELEKINLAFKHVTSDPHFKFGTRVQGKKYDSNAKKFIIEMYEKATGRKLI